MLLYESDSERNLATIDYINQGLKENHLCVYASVDAYDQQHLSKISSKIVEFKENINKRNLIIVNLKPFYDSALMANLTPFEKLKKQIQSRSNNKSVIIVADCADNLFQNQYFDQSELVESWWHHFYNEWVQKDNNQGKYHITIVCPHLKLLLSKHPFDKHKCKILDNHSLTIDMAGHTIMTSPTLNKHMEKLPYGLQSQPILKWNLKHTFSLLNQTRSFGLFIACGFDPRASRTY